MLLCIFSIAEASQEDCTPGTFYDGDSCKPCPSGTYQFKKGQTSCTPCPPGTYFSFVGGHGRDVCRPCPENTYQGNEGATSQSACKPCPRGTAAAPYSSHCLSCPPGSAVTVCDLESTVQSGRCRSCYRYFCWEYEPRPVCETCRKYYFASKPNSLKCDVCPTDSDSKAGSARCRKCPREGCQGCRNFMVYDPNDVVDDPFVSFDIVRTSGCRPCPAGFVGNREVNATRCVRCAPGTFKNDTSAGSCLPCSTDSKKIASGSSCSVCNQQQKFNPDSQRCEACGNNYFSAGGKGTTCMICPRGSTGSRDGCKCLPGWERASDGSCKICPPGSEGPHFYETTCSRCSPGKIARFAGTAADGCRPCPSGAVPNQRQTRCIPFSPSCPIGFFASGRECIAFATNCPKGKRRQNFLHPGKMENFSCN